MMSCYNRDEICEFLLAIENGSIPISTEDDDLLKIHCYSFNCDLISESEFFSIAYEYYAKYSHFLFSSIVSKPSPVVVSALPVLKSEITFPENVRKLSKICLPRLKSATASEVPVCKVIVREPLVVKECLKPAYATICEIPTFECADLFVDSYASCNAVVCEIPMFRLDYTPAPYYLSEIVPICENDDPYDDADFDLVSERARECYTKPTPLEICVELKPFPLCRVDSVVIPLLLATKTMPLLLFKPFEFADYKVVYSSVKSKSSFEPHVCYVEAHTRAEIDTVIEHFARYNRYLKINEVDSRRVFGDKPLSFVETPTVPLCKYVPFTNYVLKPKFCHAVNILRTPARVKLIPLPIPSFHGSIDTLYEPVTLIEGFRFESPRRHRGNRGADHDVFIPEGTSTIATAVAVLSVAGAAIRNANAIYGAVRELWSALRPEPKALDHIRKESKRLAHKVCDKTALEAVRSVTRSPSRGVSPPKGDVDLGVSPPIRKDPPERVASTSSDKHESPNVSVTPCGNVSSSLESCRSDPAVVHAVQKDPHIEAVSECANPSGKVSSVLARTNSMVEGVEVYLTGEPVIEKEPLTVTSESCETKPSLMKDPKFLELVNCYDLMLTRLEEPMEKSAKLLLRASVCQYRTQILNYVKENYSDEALLQVSECLG